MAKDYAGIAAVVLSSINYGTLATVSETGAPWNCPVIMVHDHDLNFYWFSDRRSQHAQNLRHHPSVFIVFYDSTVPKHGLNYGVYVQAQASEVTNAQTIAEALQILWGRDKEGPEIFSGQSPRRVYQGVPERVWVNDVELRDDRRYIRDYRVEVERSDLRAKLVAA